jgi:hypothetical protein
MKARQISAGIVLAAIAGLGGGAVSTTGADDRRGSPKPAYHAPAPPRFNHEEEEKAKLNQILANQQLLLQRLGELNDSTLPGAIARVTPLLDSIKADTLGILEGLGGLQTQCSTPDLLPVPDPGFQYPPWGFCRIDSANHLRVRVQNQGGVDAGASTTQVTYLGSVVETVVVPTGPLSAFGGAIDLDAGPIPTTCLPAADSAAAGTCNFTINVDFGNVVAEGNEPNNLAVGQCVRII